MQGVNGSSVQRGLRTQQAERKDDVEAPRARALAASPDDVTERRAASNDVVDGARRHALGIEDQIRERVDPTVMKKPNGSTRPIGRGRGHDD
jgi:hypothetical protein